MTAAIFFTKQQSLINDLGRKPSPFFHSIMIIPIIRDTRLSSGSPTKKRHRDKDTG